MLCARLAEAEELDRMVVDGLEAAFPDNAGGETGRGAPVDVFYLFAIRADQMVVMVADELIVRVLVLQIHFLHYSRFEERFKAAIEGRGIERLPVLQGRKLGDAHRMARPREDAHERKALRGRPEPVRPQEIGVHAVFVHAV